MYPMKRCGAMVNCTIYLYSMRLSWSHHWDILVSEVCRYSMNDGATYQPHHFNTQVYTMRLSSLGHLGECSMQMGPGRAPKAVVKYRFGNENLNCTQHWYTLNIHSVNLQDRTQYDTDWWLCFANNALGTQIFEWSAYCKCSAEHILYISCRVYKVHRVHFIHDCITEHSDNYVVQDIYWDSILYNCITQHNPIV